MPIQTGSLAYLSLSDDGGTTFERLGNSDDLTFNLNQAEIEAGHRDDGGWTFKLAGKQDGTIDFSARYNKDDAGQTILYAHYFSKTALKVEWGMTEGTGEEKYTADAFVTSLVNAGPDGDAAMKTGSITIATQPVAGVQA